MIYIILIFSSLIFSFFFNFLKIMTNAYLSKHFNFISVSVYDGLFSDFRYYKCVDPAFLAIMRSPLKMRDSFFFKKKLFLENGLESPLIFVFILKGKTK